MLVGDLMQTVAFYQRVLGFEVAMRLLEGGRVVAVLLRRDEAEVLVHARAALPAWAPAPSPLRLALCLPVHGVAAYFRLLRPHVEVVHALAPAPEGGLTFTVRDVNGVLLTFVEAGEAQAPPSVPRSA